MAENDPSGRELVVAAIPGVQKFVAESRRTSDLFASSELISELAAALVGAVTEPAELVLPASADLGKGMPNRVVALARQGQGKALAERMVHAVRERWKDLLDGEAPPQGFPIVQWVVVPPSEKYEEQWKRAQRLLSQRKRIKDFTFPPQPQARVCSLTGRWPATAPQKGIRARPGEFLSSVALVKRRRGQRVAFPSTWSIASAPYRAGLIETGDPRAVELCEELEVALDMLAKSVENQDAPVRPAGSGASRGGSFGARVSRGGGALPDMPKTETLIWLRGTEGAWVAPQTWDAEALCHEYGWAGDAGDLAYACEEGRNAAGRLQTLGRELGVTELSPYLAVLAQDADRLGEKLGDVRMANGPMRHWHERVSQALADAGRRQRAVIESSGHFGRVVYAGGDDLLALLPLATATRAAAKSFTAFQTAMVDVLPTASISTALVFFHVSSPLQSAVAVAQRLLEQAKERSRPGVAIAVRHRGGERVTWTSPWEGDVVEHLGTLVSAMGGVGTLSKQLAMGLERDRDELGTLDSDWLRMELSRRAVRHGMAESGARALAALAQDGSRDTSYVDALLVARFLAAEGARAVERARAAEGAR